MKYFYSFPLIIFLIIIFSCNIITPEFNGINNIKISEFDKEKITLEVLMNINNNGNLSYKIKDLDLDLNYNGIEIGKAKLKNSVVINKKSSSVYSFMIETPSKNLTKAALPSLISLISKQKPELKISGILKISTLFVTKRIPVDFTQNINLLKSIN